MTGGTRTVRGALVAALVLVLVLGAAACGGGSGSGRPAAHGSAATGTVAVLAAASLKESFTRLGADFESANPGTRVTFSFAGSSTLAAQINQGIPADVFASASPVNMKTVTDAGNGDGKPTIFARNRLVIAVPKGNPRRVTGLTDLARPGTKVALCAEQVPCGAAARQALTAAKVELTPATLEPDVKAALAKVKLGEVDAALVYRTDAESAASEVDGVEFPEAAAAVNDYPIVALRHPPNPAGAKAFVAYVRSDHGRAVLDRYGFQPPEAG